MKSYVVAKRPLTHNGKSLKVGDSIRLSAEDGEALIGSGRIKEAPSASTTTASAAKAK